MVKGLTIGWSVILVILCCGETSAHVIRRRRHIRASNICSNPGLQYSFQSTLNTVENVLENIKCRIYQERNCSDAVLKIAGSSKTSSIPVVCNSEFLNVTLRFLEKSYSKVAEISHVINTLQNRLFLTEDDPLEGLTNSLLNNIRVIVRIIKPYYDVMQVATSQQYLDNYVKGESAMLMTYTGIASSIESYLKAAICVVQNN